MCRLETEEVSAGKQPSSVSFAVTAELYVAGARKRKHLTHLPINEHISRFSDVVPGRSCFTGVLVCFRSRPSATMRTWAYNICYLCTVSDDDSIIQTLSIVDFSPTSKNDTGRRAAWLWSPSQNSYQLVLKSFRHLLQWRSPRQLSIDAAVYFVHAMFTILMQ
jgi:hypothetical protein